MGKFLRNIKTGVVWGHTELLAIHPDFVPHEADVKEMDESERAAIIVKAIKAIPREEWGTGGTMPLVGDVSEKDKITELVLAVENLQKRYGHLQLLLTGPWPPYNFVEFNIK